MPVHVSIPLKSVYNIGSGSTEGDMVGQAVPVPRQETAGAWPAHPWWRRCCPRNPTSPDRPICCARCACCPASASCRSLTIPTHPVLYQESINLPFIVKALSPKPYIFHDENYVLRSCFKIFTFLTETEQADAPGPLRARRAARLQISILAL